MNLSIFEQVAGNGVFLKSGENLSSKIWRKCDKSEMKEDGKPSFFVCESRIFRGLKTGKWSEKGKNFYKFVTNAYFSNERDGYKPL